MTIISPSLLSCDFLHLEKEIKAFDKQENIWIHLDIMDGHFVPNITFGPTVIKKIQTITNHKLDAHLMVTNPRDYISWLEECGIYNLTFHWEASGINGHHDVLINEIKSKFPSVGISLNPSTLIESIPDFILKKIDLVLIMSVNPGFGGQQFIDSSFDKIEKLAQRRKKLNCNFTIQVDGGVTNKNAHLLIDAGSDNLVAGSYIFSSKNFNYDDKIKSLRK